MQLVERNGVVMALFVDVVSSASESAAGTTSVDGSTSTAMTNKTDSDSDFESDECESDKRSSSLASSAASTSLKAKLLRRGTEPLQLRPHDAAVRLRASVTKCDI